jgi:hypothetical protein
LGQWSERFTADLRAYAEGGGALRIGSEPGERKEDHTKPLLDAASQRLLPGLVAVGVARADDRLEGHEAATAGMGQTGRGTSDTRGLDPSKT